MQRLNGELGMPNAHSLLQFLNRLTIRAQYCRVSTNSAAYYLIGRPDTTMPAAEIHRPPAFCVDRMSYWLLICNLHSIVSHSPQCEQHHGELLQDAQLECLLQQNPLVLAIENRESY